MGWRASRRASLIELVEMAKPLLRRAELDCPRTGRGRRPTIPDWVLGALIMVAVLKRRKTKSGQYRFLEQHRELLKRALGVSVFPARSTYFDRYQRAHHLFRAAVRLQGRQAIREGLIDATCVAADKSLISACGPVWHKKQRQRGVVPRGVDREGTWSYSEHHGWVYGYGFEVVVTAAKNGVVFPLLADVETASVREMRTFLAKIPDLPPQTKHVLVDSGYDSNDIGEAIEWTSDGKRTGRRCLCRQVKPSPSRKARTKWRETHRRQQRRQRREARRKYLETAAAKRLYRRRGKTVEPFHHWFKHLFQIEDHVWHRGLDNNRTHLLTAVFCYQLLLRHNHRRKLPHGQIQWILDGL
jgi:hypothetical protein